MTVQDGHAHLRSVEAGEAPLGGVGLFPPAALASDPSVGLRPVRRGPSISDFVIDGITVRRPTSSRTGRDWIRSAWQCLGSDQTVSWVASWTSCGG